MDDPYTVLGVTPGAGQGEIDAAYRALSQKFHPAQHTQDSPAERAAWAAAMDRVEAAYRLVTERAGTNQDPVGPPASNAAAWSPPATSDLNLVVSQCQQCGAKPARQVTFRHQIGLVILTQRHVGGGIFCRNCGLAKVRSAQNRTLLLGWYGVFSALRNLGAMADNWREMTALKKLEPPSSPVPGTRQLSPGRPVLLRSGTLAGAAVVTLVAVLGFKAATAPESTSWGVGACVLGDDKVQPVECGGRHDGQVVTRANRASACPATAESYVFVEGTTDVWCVDLDK